MALNPEERQAITDLFEHMRQNGLADKDPEAEALINQLIRRTPDSAYLLVQSVLIQEQQIGEYEQYMDDLEARNKELEEQLAGGSRPAQSGGGFLGGARRGAAPAPQRDDGRGSSGIPPIGSRTAPGPYEPQARGREPYYASRPGAPEPQQQQPAQAGGGGGGFLRTAAAMAAGVAGGALLSNSLGGMFGGNKSGEAQAGQHRGGGDRDSASTQNEDMHHDASDNDPGTYDRHEDSGNEWGSDDIEV